MEANKKTINDIFNGNRVLEIPFFQRAYVWREAQWERMLQDMEMVSEMAKPYFMGSVILKQQPTSTSQSVGDRRTLIDGQQRLTTLCIFLKVLALKTNQEAIFDRTFRLIDNQEIALDHNHHDKASFDQVVALKREVALTPSNAILQAYEYFRVHLDVKKLSLAHIRNNVTFVGIDLGVEEDEQQIFDTINSLGVRLTTAELLKNYLFDRSNANEFLTYWRDIFEKDEQTKNFWDQPVTAGRTVRENIDLFLHSFLIIKIQDQSLEVRAEDKKSFGRVEGVFASYKKLIEDYELNKTDLIAEISQYATLYRNSIDSVVLESELSDDCSLERINAIIFGLENSTIIPYVLFVLRNVDAIEERDRLFTYLESYLMRRLVCHAGTKNYNQLFSDRLIGNRILTAEALHTLLSEQSDGVNYMPGDEEMQEAFHRVRLTNKQATGILYMIESKIRNRRKHSTALLGLDYYSLEHIMPKKWFNNWDYPATQKLVDLRDQQLLTLGNLTIIPACLNSSLRDADWTIKKEGSGQRKGLRHYAGGIETFAPYLEESCWSEEVITRRADWLHEQASAIWRNELVSESPVTAAYKERQIS